MAMGRDPNRTILVELGDLRPFSDIAGRHTIRVDDTSQRRQELAQRLQAAGCAVNLDGTDWHAAGDFEAALASSKTETEQSVTGTVEEQRFAEILEGSRDVRLRISRLLDPTGQRKTTLDTENLGIALEVLSGQMSVVGMNELHERLAQPAETNVEAKEKLRRISRMLALLEVWIVNHSFENAKREFASYDPVADDA